MSIYEVTLKGKKDAVHIRRVHHFSIVKDMLEFYNEDSSFVVSFPLSSIKTIMKHTTYLDDSE